MNTPASDPILLSGPIDCYARPVEHVPVFDYAYLLRPTIRPLPEIRLTLHDLTAASRGRIVSAFNNERVERFAARPDGSEFEFQFSGLITMISEDSAHANPFVVKIQIKNEPMNAIPLLVVDGAQTTPVNPAAL